MRKCRWVAIYCWKQQLRPLVKAPAGKCIIECDYAQMEVSVIAALSQDPVLISDYNTGDVYLALAQALDIQREQAKLIFLGILYGANQRSLKAWLGRSDDEVTELVNDFFVRYDVLYSYQEDQVRMGLELGYVESVTGIRRSVNSRARALVSDTNAIQKWESNWFKNYPVQSSSAVVFKTALIEVAENVEPKDFHLIAPLYYAIIFEVDAGQAEYYTDLVCSAMKRAMKKYFPALQPSVTVNDYDVSCWNGGQSSIDVSECLAEV